MANFDSFVARHGEFGVQALLEKIEHYEGIRSASASSLKDRWNAVMNVRPTTDWRVAA